MHSSCLFENCSRNDNGGTIYFSCNGAIVQRRFCALKSYTTKENCWGCYSYSYLIQDSKSSNTITECSVCHCEDNFSVGTIFSQYGNVALFSSNITNINIVKFNVHWIIDVTGEGKIKFSNFQNNFAKERITFGIKESSFLYHCCNVINNTQFTNLRGTFYSENGIFTIINSTILHSSENGVTFASQLTYNLKYIIINCTLDAFTSCVRASASHSGFSTPEVHQSSLTYVLFSLTNELISRTH